MKMITGLSWRSTITKAGVYKIYSTHAEYDKIDAETVNFFKPDPSNK